MSWQFDKGIKKIVNGTEYSIALCTSPNDFGNSTHFIQVRNSVMYYSPLNSSSGANPYTLAIQKIINCNVYYPHLNKCKVSVTYNRSTTNPTSGVNVYTWTITKIEFEMPLPVATQGMLSVPANTKVRSGTLQTYTQMNNSTLQFSIAASYNGAYVSGSVNLTSSGTATFYLS